ncbi:hypothetical protein DPMN_060575 [Dreissena polymorpha]|uniref:Uncharacterized protein n=1 Tax=Dreissena polymorpha TaxID=45954 RepID=A0A9D4C699_DREPO|nr:hypothetical protein DPMN_060575 [Dreissena polymorpha]
MLVSHHVHTGFLLPRSGSFPSDLTVSVAPDNAHRKTGSFDALSSPNLQQKPARPKPPVQEK